MKRQFNVFARLKPRRSSRGGFTLVEALVALVIFSVGLLGILGLHGVTLIGNDESRGVSAARALALSGMDFLERLPANHRALRECANWDINNPQWCSVDAGTVVGATPTFTANAVPANANAAALLDETGRISNNGRYRRYWTVDDIPPAAGSSSVTRMIRLRISWQDLAIQPATGRTHNVTYTLVRVF